MTCQCGAPLFGVEDWTVCDGVLFYGCAACGRTYPREFDSPARTERACQLAAEWSSRFLPPDGTPGDV